MLSHPHLGGNQRNTQAYQQWHLAMQIGFLICAGFQIRLYPPLRFLLSPQCNECELIFVCGADCFETLVIKSSTTTTTTKTSPPRDNIIITLGSPHSTDLSTIPKQTFPLLKVAAMKTAYSKACRLLSPKVMTNKFFCESKRCCCISTKLHFFAAVGQQTKSHYPLFLPGWTKT